MSRLSTGNMMVASDPTGIIDLIFEISNVENVLPPWLVLMETDLIITLTLPVFRISIANDPVCQVTKSILT